MSAPVVKTPKEFSPAILAAMQFAAGGCAGDDIVHSTLHPRQYSPHFSVEY